MSGAARSVFSGGRVLVDGELVPADVVVENGTIAGVVEAGAASRGDWAGVDVIDVDARHGRGAIIAPGFVDTQCNGAMGYDITADPRSIGAIAEVLPRWGVTSFLPTVITSTPEARGAALREVGRMGAGPSASAADVAGLHFEGPALSSQRLGTHDPQLQAIPETAEIDRWCDSGLVTLVTLAPELRGADVLIDRLVAAGIAVSAGHTGATGEGIRTALDCGVRGVTHLFNAMPQLGHRDPGPVGVVLDDPRAFAGLICDGVHVDPTVIRLAWKLLGAQRTVLVTDGTAAMGMPDGTHALGSTRITLERGVVRNGAGALAGSALTMSAAVDNLIEYTGCSVAEAVTAASETPARFADLDDRGAIVVGRRADLVVLDDRSEAHSATDSQTGERHIRVLATYVKGLAAWKS